MLKCRITANIGGNISSSTQLNMDYDTEEWKQLKKAIDDGDVSTIQALLTRYPDLIRYRDKTFVSHHRTLYAADDVV
jgi:hypothetical protein